MLGQVRIATIHLVNSIQLPSSMGVYKTKDEDPLHFVEIQDQIYKMLSYIEFGVYTLENPNIKP